MTDDLPVYSGTAPGGDNFVDGLPVWNHSLLNDEDLRNYRQGHLYNAYDYFGNHFIDISDTHGCYFAVWAPHASKVSVVGDFNHWQGNQHALFLRSAESGIWEGFIPDFKIGTKYKYQVDGYKGALLTKGDPYAQFWETRPGTASISYNTRYEWKDDE